MDREKFIGNDVLKNFDLIEKASFLKCLQLQTCTSICFIYCCSCRLCQVGLYLLL